MSAAELFAWAELRHWGERRRAELDWLLSNRYAVMGFELGLALEWARIQADGAAVTHNRKNFERVPGIRLLPPPQSLGQD
jgi:predicted nucleic acid-binding protein